jgi:integrase
MNTKITVNIDARKPSTILRLRWKDSTGKRSLSLGLKDSLPNRARAESIKKQIEDDWQAETYDQSLFRYKPQITGSNATDISSSELFARFTKSKLRAGDISEHTASVRYKSLQNVLKAKLDKPVSEIDRKAAENLADYFAGKVSPEVAKHQITLIKACWNWAEGSYQVNKDVWLNLNKRFKSVPKRDIEPFTRDEVRSIVNGFKHSQKYCHLADFVICLFGTGARFGEIVALTWADVKPDYSSIWVGKSITGKFHNSTTKTGKARNVLLSPSVGTMFETRRADGNPQPGDLIFPERDGRSINNDNFLPRWQSILKNAGVVYRKPYSTRHTAISHALENGANPLDVAAQCGHDVKTLFDRYAHVIQQKQVFTEFL